MHAHRPHCSSFYAAGQPQSSQTAFWMSLHFDHQYHEQPNAIPYHTIGDTKHRVYAKYYAGSIKWHVRGKQKCFFQPTSPTDHF